MVPAPAALQRCTTAVFVRAEVWSSAWFSLRVVLPPTGGPSLTGAQFQNGAYSIPIKPSVKVREGGNPDQNLTDEVSKYIVAGYLASKV